MSRIRRLVALVGLASRPVRAASEQPPQPARPPRGPAHRHRRLLGLITALATIAITWMVHAPVASAQSLAHIVAPPDGRNVAAAPPPNVVEIVSHVDPPAWAILAMLAGAALVAAATTLITLAVDRTRHHDPTEEPDSTSDEPIDLTVAAAEVLEPM